MRRRNTRNTFKSKNGKKLYAVNPDIARFLENLSLSGSSVLQEDLTVSNGIGSAVLNTVYPAGTNIESIVRDILTFDAPQATTITNFTVEDSNGATLTDQDVYEVGTELTFNQIDYTVSDEDANLQANSGKLIISFDGTSDTLLENLPVENNNSYNDITLTSPVTIGGFSSDYPADQTLQQSHVTTFRLNATTNDQEVITRSHQIEHAYPAFMLILANVADEINPVKPGGVNIPDDAAVATLFNTWNQQIIFFDPVATSLEPSLEHPKKIVSEDDSFQNHEWQVTAGINDDALPAINPAFASFNRIAVWDYFFFFPLSHPEVSKPNVQVTTASGFTYSSDFILTDESVNIDLNFLAAQIGTGYALSEQTYPYRLIELKDYNVLNNTEGQDTPTQPIIFNFTD